MSETDEFKYTYRPIKVKSYSTEAASDAKEPEPPVVKEPEPPAVKEPEPPAVKEPEPPAVKEPEPPAVKEPEPPIAKKPEPPKVDVPSAPDSEKKEAPVKKTDTTKAEKAPVHDPDSFDYIEPKHPYNKKRKYKAKHHKKSSGKKDSVSKSETEDITGDFVFASPKKRKKHLLRHRHHSSDKKRITGWKKVLIIILSVILALVIAFGATFFIMREIGRSHMHDLDDSEIVTPTEDNSIVALDPKGQIINYKGKSYELNKNILSITVIGADNSDVEGYDAKMGDAIYILAVDTKTGKIKILGVSRDTMADVDVYSIEGNYIDTEKKQISFAYSYGSKEVTGGKNTTVALSRLFFGLSLKNYFAIDLDALKTINDAIGGVTLTSSITFVSPEDGRTISEGETVTLHGEEAEYYIRSRDKSDLESNNARMDRQLQYIRAFISSIVPALKEDISRVSTLYNMTSENSESNMSLSDIVYIASDILPKIKNVGEIEYVNLKGKIKEGEFAEMYVSNDDAITAMLEVFYLPIE